MIIENIINGSVELFTLPTVILMAVGVLAGHIADAIPGFTFAMEVVLVLPFTFTVTAVQGLPTMIGVYVGGLMSGIPTGIPGTPSRSPRLSTVFPSRAAGGGADPLGGRRTKSGQSKDNRRHMATHGDAAFKYGVVCFRLAL